MTKTIENLKAAITGESTASATYAAYAAKAACSALPAQTPHVQRGVLPGGL